MTDAAELIGYGCAGLAVFLVIIIVIAAILAIMQFFR